MVSCLIVDDNAGFLAAAARLLRRQGLDVVGTAHDGVEAERLAGELRPDVVLMDIDLGGESGLEVTARLCRESELPIVLISTHAEQDYRDLIAASPAAGFLAKTDLSAAAILELLGRSQH
ncbi:response regulator transcription factor [Kribbella sp. NPDC048915]|uniref:response regulator n=1 Tax=Kribbella sp. NPDC048915 TaxID=3155148 RepID=UPI0033D4BCCA